MSVIGSNILAGASGQGGGYNLTNSLRFRSSATAYLSRTGGTSTSRRIHTFSFWTKSSVIGGTRAVASAGSDDNNREVIFIDSNKFTYQVKIASTFYDLESTQVFRDPAAWYHFVCAVDTTQATSSNRVKIYVNGVQITAFGTATYPPQNADLFFDDSNGSVSYIGALRGYVGSIGQYDGYMTEFNFIDGQALTPSSFGQTSAITGVWQPIKYTGTYGTNGFYLPFTDNSALTTSSNVGLGKDFSGNSNYWTTNGISITSGSTYDSMTDVPTLTSATAGNYATVNPLNAFGTPTNGNLSYYTTTNYQGGYATMAVSGKIYFEVSCANPTGGGALVGFVKNATIPIGITNFFTQTNFYGAIFSNTLNYYLNGSSDGLDHGNITDSMLQFAVDRDTGKCWVGSNNTWFESGDPATGANPAWTISLSSGDLLFPAFCVGNSTYTISINFGQRPFSYTPPTGFNRLNTFNLPTPTIGATASTTANKYFDATLYTGNGSTQSITNAGSFQPDFVWIKSRSPNGYQHVLQDVIRGTGQTKKLYSSLDEAENGANAPFGHLSSFDSNGFSVSIGSTNANQTNASSQTYVGWQWKANGAGVSNTAGDIASVVSANTTAGFSIVT